MSADTTILDEPKTDTAEIAKKIIYLPFTIEWKNFCNEQPEKDRKVIIWCNLGNHTDNLYITHQDQGGNWRDLVSGMQYPVRAWAYLDNPVVNQESLQAAIAELKQESVVASSELAKAC